MIFWSASTLVESFFCLGWKDQMQYNHKCFFIRIFYCWLDCSAKFQFSRQKHSEWTILTLGRKTTNKPKHALLSLHSNCFTVLLWHSGSACTLPDEMLCVNWFRESVQLKVRLIIRRSLLNCFELSHSLQECFRVLLPSI